MSTIESTSANQISRLRRFSVRTLLVAVSLLGVVLGRIAIEIRQQREDRRLAAMCIQLGASVTYTGDEGGKVTGLYFANDIDLNDEHLERFAGLSRLRTLWLNHSKVTGRGLAVLVEFPALRELHVHRDQLTDNGLRHLKQLSRLEELTIWGLRFDDPRANELQLALPGCEVGS